MAIFVDAPDGTTVLVDDAIEPVRIGGGGQAGLTHPQGHGWRIAAATAARHAPARAAGAAAKVRIISERRRPALHPLLIPHPVQPAPRGIFVALANVAFEHLR